MRHLLVRVVRFNPRRDPNVPPRAFNDVSPERQRELPPAWRGGLSSSEEVSEKVAKAGNMHRRESLAAHRAVIRKVSILLGVTERRRMRAEEKAHRLPVILSIPLVGCMLPVMIGVLMLPAVIRIIRTMMPVMAGG